MQPFQDGTAVGIAGTADLRTTGGRCARGPGPAIPDLAPPCFGCGRRTLALSLPRKRGEGTGAFVPARTLPASVLPLLRLRLRPASALPYFGAIRSATFTAPSRDMAVVFVVTKYFANMWARSHFGKVLGFAT